jgi:ATP-dependent Clp protease ATP-binding subunit ClpB
LQDANRPLGSFLFLGTTGVGKTELARALAEFLFDDEQALIRVDMSEYMEKHAVSRLLGAPPGYIGYEEGGQLTEAVLTHPYSVVLLDEIEKAHPEVFNVLLQLLDDGRLTDGQGRTVDFKNTIIIMTSNFGTDIIQERLSSLNEDDRDFLLREMKEQILTSLKQHIRPEFLNRIDEILLFSPLLQSDVQNIALIQIKKLEQKLNKSNIELMITKQALSWLGSAGYDIQFGARPLKRIIQKHISDALAVKILSGELTAGSTVKVDASPAGEPLIHILKKES